LLHLCEDGILVYACLFRQLIGEVYDKELIEEARQIIISWGGRELIRKEKEMM
jgi:hypothetical protein